MKHAIEERMRLICELRMRGITDCAVLNALERIDRADFISAGYAHNSYQDIPLPIEAGQTISQPSVVGRMSQALEVSPRHKVLEIGTGSAYQAAILSCLARRVYSVERHQRLAQSARMRLTALEIGNVVVVTGDGSFGLPEQAPFDRILVTAAAEDPPGPLLAQLRVGGIMVLPVGQTNIIQSLIKVTKKEDGFDYEELGDVRFVPLVEGVVKL